MCIADADECIRDADIRIVDAQNPPGVGLQADSRRLDAKTAHQLRGIIAPPRWRPKRPRSRRPVNRFAPCVVSEEGKDGMELLDMFAQLKKDAARHPRTFAEGRARKPALAPYATASDTLAALARTSPLDFHAKNAIVVALLLRNGLSSSSPLPATYAHISAARALISRKDERNLAVAFYTAHFSAPRDVLADSSRRPGEASQVEEESHERTPWSCSASPA